MNNWTEAALALIIVVGLGFGFYRFSGEPIGDGSTTGTTIVTTIDQEAAARGETLAMEQGCRNCHTVDGTQSPGPTWKGLAGSIRPLEGGEEVVADDNYLFNSIVDPANQIVQGYGDLMPKFYDDQLDDDQITDLVEYIKSLAT